MYTIYKGNLEKSVYPIDADAWLDDGWSLEPDSELIVDTGERINLNNTSLEALKKLGLTVADSQKIIKAEKFESVEDAIALVPTLSRYKSSLFVN
jgi:DNA uptake protein ComE-like DNA-binding protein